MKRKTHKERLKSKVIKKAKVIDDLRRQIRYLQSEVEKRNLEYSDEEVKQFDILFDRLIQMKKKGYLMFEPPEYFHKLKEFIRGKHDWKCRAGRHFFAVDADGRFMLCSDSKPIEKNLMDMDKHYYKIHKDDFDRQLAVCNRTCTENFAFCSSHYSDHKIEFLTTDVK